MSFDKQIILTSEVKEILPNSLKNIKKFIATSNEILIDMMKAIKNNDITFLEFEEKYKSLV
jgi:uncharacterized protein YbcV (DUF1398 family)